VSTPPIVIILQTFKRTDVALRTIAAAQQHLRYAGELIWYVADDGSPDEHVAAVREMLPDAGWHSERRGYGANANAAWRAADAATPLTLWLEDDWELTQPLDLTPYAQALADDEIGMVRLGYLNRGISGSAVAAAGRLYWRLYHEPVESNELVFTGHPSLRHTRYREAYGWYPEGLTPGDTELGYAYQYRTARAGAPWIVWPADYPSGGLFGHIGTVKTETML
jgi:hypothetical protein